ncbi:MAG: RloB family protein [Acidimicrobiales bacterium]
MARDRRSFGRQSLKRRVATRQPRKTLLVFCEGERTEPEYLNALKREPAVHDVAAVDIRVETGQGGSVPMTLVTMAVAARRRAAGEEGEIDEVWCVFDVEWPRNHPDLKEAAEQARQGGVEVAISNPCFELWLILHFHDHSSWLDNDDARRLRRQLDGCTDKGLDPHKYMPRIQEAARRAAALDERHVQNATFFPQDNPSSGMHRLLDAVGGLAGAEDPDRRGDGGTT